MDTSYAQQTLETLKWLSARYGYMGILRKEFHRSVEKRLLGDEEYWNYGAVMVTCNDYQPWIIATINEDTFGFKNRVCKTYLRIFFHEDWQGHDFPKDGLMILKLDLDDGLGLGWRPRHPTHGNANTLKWLKQVYDELDIYLKENSPYFNTDYNGIDPEKYLRRFWTDEEMIIDILQTE